MSKISSLANAKDCSTEAAAPDFVSATSIHRVCCEVYSHYGWVDVQKPPMSENGKKLKKKKKKFAASTQRLGASS